MTQPTFGQNDGLPERPLGLLGPLLRLLLLLGALLVLHNGVSQSLLLLGLLATAHGHLETEEGSY